MPALERGRAAGGSCGPGRLRRRRARVRVRRPTPTRSSPAAIQGTKQQIAFYASTPAYRGVLEHHGWGDLQPELTRLSKEGKWEEMGDLIDDDVVRTFAAVGDVPTVARELRERWDGVATRLSFYIALRFDADAASDAARRALARPGSVDLELRVVDPLRRELGVEALGERRGTPAATSPSGSTTTIGRPSSPPSRSAGTSGICAEQRHAELAGELLAAAGAEQLVARCRRRRGTTTCSRSRRSRRGRPSRPSPPRAARPAARPAAAW